MLKKITIYSLFILCTIHLFAQETRNVFNIKNQRSDVVIGIQGNDNSSVVLSDYGLLKSKIGNSRYLFQGQEWDDILGIYFFPARIYSPENRHFLQPDPKSQYHSPYIIVGADPVNFVDRDGNAAKALVLYGEESRSSSESRISTAAEGLQGEIDAYYYPLSDFVNGETPLDLPEWNGNVFIESHVENDGGIASEYYMKGEKFKLKKKFSEGIYGTEDGHAEFGFVRPAGISERLAELSKATNVPLKTVTLGGCEGSKAAKILNKSLGKTFRRLKGIAGRIRVQGFQKGIYTAFMSPAAKREIQSGLYKVHQIRGEAPENVQMMAHDDEHERITNDFTGESSRYYDRYGNDFPYTEREELSDFVTNGNIPQNFAPVMDTYHTDIPNYGINNRLPVVPGE